MFTMYEKKNMFNISQVLCIDFWNVTFVKFHIQPKKKNSVYSLLFAGRLNTWYPINHLCFGFPKWLKTKQIENPTINGTMKISGKIKNLKKVWY